MQPGRPLVAVTLGLWLAVLTAMLLGSATVLAVDTVSLGDMRWIGTDPSVTSEVMARMALFAGLALFVTGALVRSWIGPVRSSAAGGTVLATPGSAGHAAVVRIVAGAALLLTAGAGMVVVQASKLFG